MERRIAEAWSLETVFWIFICLFVCAAELFLAPSCRPVKAVETTLRVSDDNCREASASDADRTSLDCLSGEISVRVEMSRIAWDAMHAPDAGVLDGSAPLASAAHTTLSVDANHCKEDPRDNDKSEVALLDCESNHVTYVVALGRQEWRAIKARRTPAPYGAGPGK